MKECTLDYCERPLSARGLCVGHYTQWYKGQELTPINPHRVRTESPKYVSVHSRLRRKRGIAADFPCAFCNRKAREWAYTHKSDCELYEDWNGRTVAYSPNIDDYIPLCTNCHKAFDKR